MAGANSYWQSAAADESMQDEHRFVWKAMLDSLDVDLAGQRVLDVGCNRGGFLRMAVDSAAIAEGAGYDPASAAVADARRLAGDRPLRFEVADRVPPGWGSFDVAFSHEVLYLIHDLHAHAGEMFEALVPAGSYYAVMGMHAASSILVAWHRDHADELALPPLYDIDDVIGAFTAAGFEAAASRLALGFVPLASLEPRTMPPAGAEPRTLPPAGAEPGTLDWLDYYYDKKVLLRFTRPRG